MNSRGFLKSLLGTTLAVAIPLPFVPDTSGFITNDPEAHDKNTWWRENFTIQSVEYAYSINADENIARVFVTQNGRPEHAMYTSVRLGNNKFVKDEVLEGIKTAITFHARRQGWVTRT